MDRKERTDMWAKKIMPKNIYDIQEELNQTLHKLKINDGKIYSGEVMPDDPVIGKTLKLSEILQKMSIPPEQTKDFLRCVKLAIADSMYRGYDIDFDGLWLLKHKHMGVSNLKIYTELTYIGINHIRIQIQKALHKRFSLVDPDYLKSFKKKIVSLGSMNGKVERVEIENKNTDTDEEPVC